MLLLLSFTLQSCGKKVLVFEPKKCSYTYRVKGKTYCVRRSSTGYVEVGIASWYGPGFHGKRTASGEFYNMYKLTAAHKTLPLGTYVRVINLENGKSVVVKINDRGPFVPGRIIDLSYAAAKRIGMLSKGTARVKIIALGRRVDHRYRQENYEKGRFYVQVGAFKNKLNAYRFKHKLLRKYGIKAKVVKLEGYYRVLAGPIFTYSAAEAYRKKLKRLGLRGSFIIRY
ncbi:rare lipoprotein A [Phorcysia thermohydrogeniphila]|uniref:Probable endolytic peptidoglycan transglycosylase RlpA n=1 Tax=Phorcysia thermohydrogeniphila TaxID=936138 RepID=A0A4R1GKU9_9BACT|nr:rare lipoprotein A [Phorcysia thermohydrogeniphila]